MKVIVTTSQWSRPGGVPDLYVNLKDHFTSDVEFFFTGSRAENEGKWTVLARMLGDMWKFHLRLRKKDAQIVHLNPSLGAKALIRDGMLLLLARCHGVPVIVMFHGWNEKVERILGKTFRGVFRRVYGKAAAIVTLGAVFSKKLKALGLAPPTYETTTAVDRQFSDAFKTAVVRRKSPGEEFRILYLARIEKVKGVYETVDAYRLVRAKYPLARLTMAGDGNELAALKEYVERQGISGVEFPGYVRGEDKCRLFADADVYLLPSSHGEGLPVSLLEAMVAGVPVITRPVGAISEVVVEGQNGFLTESLRPEDLARLVEVLIGDPALRAEMGKRNRTVGTERFLASKVAARLDAIYEEVLSGTRKPVPTPQQGD